MILVFLLNVTEDLFYIDAIIKLDLVFANEVIGKLPAQLRSTFFALCKISEEKCNADQGIAAIMQIGKNNTSISFAADHSIYFFHFIYNIHFTNSAWKIFAAIFQGYIFQCS